MCCPSGYTCSRPSCTVHQTKGDQNPQSRRRGFHNTEHWWERRDQHTRAGTMRHRLSAAACEALLAPLAACAHVHLSSRLTLNGCGLCAGGVACYSRGGCEPAARQRGRAHVHCQRGHRPHRCSPPQPEAGDTMPMYRTFPANAAHLIAGSPVAPVPMPQQLTCGRPCGFRHERAVWPVVHLTFPGGDVPQASAGSRHTCWGTRAWRGPPTRAR